MNCSNCGAELPDQARACPTCGVQFAPPLLGAASPQAAWTGPTVEPAAGSIWPAAPSTVPSTPQPGQLIPKKRRTGLIVAVVAGAVVLIGVAAAAVLLVGAPKSAGPRPAMPPAYAPVPVDTSFEVSATAGVDTSSTSGADQADKTAAESAVVKFYDTINTGDVAAVKKLATPDTAATIAAGTFASWASTTFEVTWSRVDAGAAYVYGRESRREFGSQDLGVKFTLTRTGGVWLIEAWTGVDAATLSGGTPASGAGSGATALNETSARDTVTSLLKARQTGDSQTVRLLTTAKFQTDNGGVWLDGTDNTPYFTGFTIKSVKAKGAGYVVTTAESWNSGPETGTYTVVNEAGTVLVDSWSSK